MYSAYFNMIETIYHYYYDENDKRRFRVENKEQVYTYLTSVPPKLGNGYFNVIPQWLEHDFLKICEEKFINTSKQSYYHIYSDNEPPEKGYIVARTVANICRQTEAMEAACLLADAFQNKQHLPVTRTIYQFKILLGRASDSAYVKMDKIVIYNFLPLQKLASVAAALEEQMNFLSFYCLDYAPLPQFVARPFISSPVGFGEGHNSSLERMGFSYVRAGCIFNVVSKNEHISVQQFERLLSAEFKKNGLSENIPFINQCAKKDEGKWLSK